MPSLAGEFRITIIFLEQSDGFAIADTYHDLTFLTIFTRCAVGTNQVDVVLCVRDTHTAWLGCHPGEGAEGHGGLRLSEALHDVEADQFLQLIEDGRIQCLTSGTTILQ